MASFNQVILLGNLTRDPQLRYTPSQMAVCDFGLAVNRKFKAADGSDREEVTFVDCTAWGKQAELINKFLSKGKPLFIQGRLKLDQWEDKQGGGKRSKLSVVVENFQFVGGRDGGGPAPSDPGGYDDANSGRAPARPAQRAGQSTRQQQPPVDEQPPIPEESQISGDDIPF